MVTRNGEAKDVGDQIMGQMFAEPKSLAVAGVVLFLLGVIPGMPHLVFISAALMSWAGAYYIHWRNQGGTFEDLKNKRSNKAGKGAATDKGSNLPGAVGQPPLPGEALPEHEIKELGWDDVEAVDRVGLEVGYRLIPLVDKNQGGQLLARIKGVRKKLSQDVGFLMPSVHIRDNLDLLPNQYRITLMGVTLAEAEIYPERDMAINPGQVFGKLEGVETFDPAFGLEALWIETTQKDKAQTLGYTVVDSSTVVATHLNQLLNQHSHELIGHEDVQKMLDILGKTSPKLAEELVPNTVSVSQLLSVLQSLLREDVPVRDMRTIAESLANMSPVSQEIAALTSAARAGLARLIVQNIFGTADELSVMTLEPSLEQLLLKTVQQSAQQTGNMDTLVIEPSMADALQRSLMNATQEQENAGRAAVLVVSSQLRAVMSRFVRNTIEHLSVLSYQEIPDNKTITIVATVGAQ